MQVKSTETQQINCRRAKKYSRSHYWKSYIKFQLALNFYYFWNRMYILLPFINYAMERVHSVSCNIVYHMSDKDSVPLTDNGFRIIPRTQISTHGQLIAMFVGGVLFGLLRFIFKMDGNNYTFAIIFSRYAVLCSIAIICRVISFLSTVLPSPHVHCHNEDFNPPTGWDIITALNLAKGCGDLIFSSHMMHFLIPLFLIVWYSLPSYDQRKVTKLMDKIKGMKIKIQQSTEPQQIQKLRKKSVKIYQKLHAKYRSDMIRNAQKMRSFNWRWALIAFLPFFALIFVVLVISSRGHYTVDVVVSLYFIPFMCYFVMHHWKEEIGKALEERVIIYYPKLCKNYVQILNNDDFGSSNQLKFTSSEAQFDVQKSNSHEIISLDQIRTSDKKKIKSNGQITQSSTAASSSKYEAVNGFFGAAVNLGKQNGQFLEEDEEEDDN